MSEDGFLFGSADALALVPHAMAVKYTVLAQRVDGNELHVIVPESSDEDVIDRIRATTGMRIRVREAPKDQIRRAIANGYRSSGRESEDLAHDPPAIRAVDALHEHALRLGASDIHVEPQAQGGRVRLRVDGMLREHQTIDSKLYLPLVSRIKLLASMDIAERRQPQDGRYAIERDGASFDARVSSVPTISGERLAIRLLDMHARVPSLEQLGMTPSVLAQYRSAVHAAHGLLVVCGPVGSGKTTTLYASLSERNVESQHLCSVEDPVEIRMGGVAQVQVNQRAGVTFASALRAFLRQDPNVVMLGEMRDAESASVALSAALSGQLVLTTLHANDASSAVERLGELGVSRRTMGAALSAIVAQRLVRRLCTRCRRPATLHAQDAAWLRLPAATAAWEPAGCAHCHHSGYRGRTGVFELLPMSDPIRHAIANGDPIWTIAERSKESGFQPMAMAAGLRVESGETSASEVRRVLSPGPRCI